MAINPLGPRPRSDPERVAEIKRWVADTFQLADNAPILVTELRCAEPDCPPIETVIAIMGRDGAACCPPTYRLRKPLIEVTRADVARLATDTTHQQGHACQQPTRTEISPGPRREESRSHDN